MARRQDRALLAALPFARAQPVATAEFDPLSAGRLAETRDSNRILTAHALPVMKSLYDQIVATESVSPL